MAASEHAPWLGRDGLPLSCRDKVDVLNANWDELRAVAHEAIDQALTLGCDREALIERLLSLVNELSAAFP